MPLLNRIHSGLVFVDDFASGQLHPRWQVSPSDNSRYSLTDRPGYLRLKHGYPDLFILMDSPRFDYVLEAETSYVPVRPTDQGGIVAFRDNETYIELLEYYDPQTGTTYAYDLIRMVRRGDLLEGYGSNNAGATWELIGTSYLSAPKVGLSLHGVQESTSDDLDVSSIRMYKDTIIQIGNLREGQIVKLVDDTGMVAAEATCMPDKDYADINCMNVRFPFKGRVQLYDSGNFMLDQSELLEDVWGGDIFWYGVKLELEIDGVSLRQDREYQLGSMEGGSIERRAYVINNNDIPLRAVKASVMALSEYYGWEWTDIAGDSFGLPNIYGDVLLIGDMNPGDRIPIWIKVTRQPYQQLASLHDYKFRVMFESG